jgi:hypothetical protein
VNNPGIGASIGILLIWLAEKQGWMWWQQLQ